MSLPIADASAVTAARGILAGAERVTVLTGAGISTDSGIPDFRGPNGVWTKNPKAERTSNIEYYVRDPEVRRLAWQGRIAWMEREVEPNPGHLALVDLERSGRLHQLVTQNIDGLHQAAGSDPDLIVEVHGTMRDVVCLSCGDRRPTGPVLDRVRAGDPDPVCEICGGMLKSATISFGQNLVPEDLDRADRAARECDVLLAVGSTLSVFPVAAMVPMAHQAGAKIVIVNGSSTEMDGLADVVVVGSISDVLPAIVAED